MTRNEMRALLTGMGATPANIEAALALMPLEAPVRTGGFISMTLPSGEKIEGEIDANGALVGGSGGRDGRGA